jgi:hypothetical protein
MFFYEDISGDPYRIIPTDGRPLRADANLTYYEDSVPWFGEEGYFHTAALHVTERFWRNGENLVYQFTMDDPGVLTAPWTAPPRVVKPSTEPLEEWPRCSNDDGKRLTNTDHHGQR